MAEGNYYLMRREEFAAKFPDVPLEDAGIGNMTVLGIEAVGTYVDSECSDGDEPKTELADSLCGSMAWLKAVRERGTNGKLVIPASRFYPREECTYHESELLAEVAEIEANPELAHSQCCREAHDWFMQNAEKW